MAPLILYVFYNKLGYKFTWNNYEIWSWCFLLLCFIKSSYLLASLVMIAGMRYIFSDLLEMPVSRWKRLLGKIGYYMSSVVPSIIIFILFTPKWIWHRNEFWDLLWMHSIWRVTIIIAVLTILAYIIEKNRSWGLLYREREIVEVIKEVVIKQEIIKEVLVEKVVEVPVETHDAAGLPKKIALNEMYTYLLHVAGVGPLFLDMYMIRFFDLVAIKTESKSHHVIFSDGTMVRCDAIMRVLEGINMRHWMVKISDSYMVNMFLVDFPHYKKGRLLLLQTESIEGLKRKMATADIVLMLTMGAGITDRYIKEFWSTRNSLTHMGWDEWVPIRK